MKDSPGERLRDVRSTKGISREELSELAKVGVNTIWKFETDRKIPNEKIIKKLVDVLGITHKYLMSGKAGPDIDEESVKRLQIKAVALVNKYYVDYRFSDNLMIDIATELFDLLAIKETLEDKKVVESFKKDLHEKYAAGLAANCLLEYLEDENIKR